MKKQLLLIAGLLTAGSLSAQITVTQWDIAAEGSVIPQARDTMPSGVVAGTGGANQTWDYSSINEHEVDTLTFTNPAWTQNGADFPTANLAAVFGQGGQSFVFYLEKDANGLRGIGQAGDLFGTGMMSLPLNPADVIIEFPAEYMDTYSGSSGFDETFDGSGIGVDSIRIKSVTQKSYTIDGWGDVTTPLGTYPALRVNATTTQTDSSWMYAFGIWQLVDDNTTNGGQIEFWTDDANVGFPLVTLGLDSAGNVEGVDWLKALPSPNGVNEFDNGATVSVYPNPTSSFVNFVVESENARSVEIYNVNGQLIEAKNINNLATTFDVSGQVSGMYMYMLKAENGELLTTGKFTVLK